MKNTEKVYARQVAPDCQGLDLIDDDFFDGMAWLGGRGYNTHLPAELQNIADEWDNMQYSIENDEYPTLAALLDAHGVQRDDGKPWSTRQRHAWRVLLDNNLLGDALSGRYWPQRDELDDVQAAMQLLTGKRHDWTRLHGCCQGEEVCVVYAPEDYPGGLAWHEAAYFNTGTEWAIIHAEHVEADTVGEADAEYYAYTEHYNDDDTRAWIADLEGVQPCDVVIFKHTGYTRSAIYITV